MTGRIAFYAPMKWPGHPVPSGDRRFARLLVHALKTAGFNVDLASRLSSRNGKGDPVRQCAIETRATRSLAAVLARYRSSPPDLWLTYHVYHKAPDLLGPAVADALNIPYVIAEGSDSPRQTQGPWARGQHLAEAALQRADLFLQPNPKDRAGLAALTDAPQIDLPPFLDVAQESQARVRRDTVRAHWAEVLSLDPNKPWLIATGMMRAGDKAQSFEILAKALPDLPLLLIGDGSVRTQVEAQFAGRQHTRFLGAQDRATIRDLNAAADLFVWPGIGEAFGLAVLEALAAGLPAVLGDRPGIRAMTGNGTVAVLTPEGDVAAFGQAVAAMLQDPAQREALGTAAAANTKACHDLRQAAEILKASLSPLMERRA